jgi:GntR family transcriptional regulator
MSYDFIEAAPGTPLYKGVKRRITQSLRACEWKPGEAIPSEKALAERFSVSIGTLRKAVDELTAENVLVRQQGRGTYVSSHGRGSYFFAFFHIVRQDGLREFPMVELLAFERGEADEDAATALKIRTGDPIFRFVNRLALQGRPTLLDEITIPVAVAPDLSETMLRRRQSTIYQLYQEEFNVSVIRTSDRLRATSADPTRATRLNVAPGHPLLLVVRLAMSFGDKPVELRHSYVNTDLHEYCSDEFHQDGHLMST